MRERYSRQLALVTGLLLVAATALFALMQSPELLESPRLASVMAARPLPHPVAGFEHCEGCHGRTGTRPYPINHWGWADTSCTRCHPPGPTPEPTGMRSG